MFIQTKILKVKLFPFCIVIITALAICSCKKDSPKLGPDQRMSVPQLLIDYGYFKPGTYWVYQDSASHARDSIYVTSSRQGIDTLLATPDQSYNGYYGYYDVYTLSTFEARKYHNWVNTVFTFSGISELNVYKFIGADSIKATDLMTDYLVVGQFPGGHPVTFENQYDSLEQSNVWYKKVLLFHDSKNATQNNSATNTYLAKNVGVIRKEILTPYKVWNLVRYQIVQ